MPEAPAATDTSHRLDETDERDCALFQARKLCSVSNQTIVDWRTPIGWDASNCGFLIQAQFPAPARMRSRAARPLHGLRLCLPARFRVLPAMRSETERDANGRSKVPRSHPAPSRFPYEATTASPDWRGRSAHRHGPVCGSAAPLQRSRAARSRGHATLQNELFEELTAAAQQFGGFVDKFLGDAHAGAVRRADTPMRTTPSARSEQPLAHARKDGAP